MDEQENTPVEDTEAGVEAPAPEAAPGEAPVEPTDTPVEAPVEAVAETSAPEGEVVLGTSSEGGVEVEPAPVIQ